MRYKDAIITALALVFSLTALTGMVYSEQFQRAARVENSGFDALAHELFNGAKLACNDAQSSEGSAQ